MQRDRLGKERSSRITEADRIAEDHLNVTTVRMNCLQVDGVEVARNGLQPQFGDSGAAVQHLGGAKIFYALDVGSVFKDAS